MMRFTSWVFACLAFTGTASAFGQEGDEIKRLKDRVDSLEVKLKATQKENELLKKEVEGFKSKEAARVASESFGVGVKLVGTYSVSYVDANGKKHVGGNDWEFSITKRTGKDFTADVWLGKRATGFQVEGTIENGVVKYKYTKALTENVPKGEIGNAIFTGRFDSPTLTGTVTTPKQNATLRGEVKAKLAKE